LVAIGAVDSTFTDADGWFTTSLGFSDGRKKMEGCGHAAIACEPITSGVYTLTLEFGSSGDSYQSIGVTDTTMRETALEGIFTYMSSCSGNFGIICRETYRNGSSQNSAFDLRGKTVTMTLDMDSRSVSFRKASGGEEYTIGDLPSSVRPICGVDENWVRIVESSSSSASAVGQQQHPLFGSYTLVRQIVNEHAVWKRDAAAAPASELPTSSGAGGGPPPTFLYYADGYWCTVEVADATNGTDLTTQLLAGGNMVGRVESTALIPNEIETAAEWQIKKEEKWEAEPDQVKCVAEQEVDSDLLRFTHLASLLWHCGSNIVWAATIAKSTLPSRLVELVNDGLIVACASNAPIMKVTALRLLPTILPTQAQLVDFFGSTLELLGQSLVFASSGTDSGTSSADCQALLHQRLLSLRQLTMQEAVQDAIADVLCEAMKQLPELVQSLLLLVARGQGSTSAQPPPPPAQLRGVGALLLFGGHLEGVCIGSKALCAIPGVAGGRNEPCTVVSISPPSALASASSSLAPKARWTTTWAGDGVDGSTTGEMQVHSPCVVSGSSSGDTGQCVRATAPLPETGTHYFELTFTRSSCSSQGSSLGSCYVAGVTSLNSMQGVKLSRLKQSPFWAYEDDASRYSNGRSSNMSSSARNGSSRGYGHQDRMGFLVDMDAKVMTVYRNGEPVEGGEFTDLTSPLYPVACPYNDNARVELSFPDAPSGISTTLQATAVSTDLAADGTDCAVVVFDTDPTQLHSVPIGAITPAVLAPPVAFVQRMCKTATLLPVFRSLLGILQGLHDAVAIDPLARPAISRTGSADDEKNKREAASNTRPVTDSEMQLLDLCSRGAKALDSLLAAHADASATFSPLLPLLARYAALSHKPSPSDVVDTSTDDDSAAGTSEPAWPAGIAFEVVGCGTTEFNGFYKQDGSEDGAPRYRLAGGSDHTLNRNSGDWYMAKGFCGSWYVVTSSASVPPSDGWRIGSNGEGGVPTLRFPGLSTPSAPATTATGSSSLPASAASDGSTCSLATLLMQAHELRSCLREAEGRMADVNSDAASTTSPAKAGGGMLSSTIVYDDTQEGPKGGLHTQCSKELQAVESALLNGKPAASCWPRTLFVRDEISVRNESPQAEDLAVGMRLYMEQEDGTVSACEVLEVKSAFDVEQAQAAMKLQPAKAMDTKDTLPVEIEVQGISSGSRHGELMGSYRLVEGKMVNGHQVWKKGRGKTGWLFYAKREKPDDVRWHWWLSVGEDTMQPGNIGGCLKVASTALTPDTATETWEVGTGSAWESKSAVRVSSRDMAEAVATEEKFTTEGKFVSSELRVTDGRMKIEGCGYACMAGEPITSGVYTLTLEFGSDGDSYQSIGVTESNGSGLEHGGTSTYMSSYSGNFGIICGKTYRNGSSRNSALDLRGKTVTMTLDMDSRSVSFRKASGGEEYTIDDLPSSVRPICGVDNNWVRIVSYKAPLMAAPSSGAPPPRRLALGDRVRLSAQPSKTSGCLGGSASEGKVGKIIKDDKDEQPFKIQCNGEENWYKEKDVVLFREPSEEELRSRPKKLSVSGQDSSDHHAEVMGEYTLMDGKQVNDRGVWQQTNGWGRSAQQDVAMLLGGDRYLYYAIGSGSGRWMWIFSNKSSMESWEGAGSLKVMTNAITPDLATEMWQVGDGSGWPEAPKVKVTSMDAPVPAPVAEEETKEEGEEEETKEEEVEGVPSKIPDPDASKPADWDDSGADWAPPMIDNPDYVAAVQARREEAEAVEAVKKATIAGALVKIFPSPQQAAMLEQGPATVPLDKLRLPNDDKITACATPNADSAAAFVLKPAVPVTALEEQQGWVKITRPSPDLGTEQGEEEFGWVEWKHDGCTQLLPQNAMFLSAHVAGTSLEGGGAHAANAHPLFRLGPPNAGASAAATPGSGNQLDTNGGAMESAVASRVIQRVNGWCRGGPALVFCKAGHHMPLTDYHGGDYSTGWVCDDCKAHFEVSKHRYCCRPCSSDYCDSCASKYSVGGEEDDADAVPLLAALRASAATNCQKLVYRLAQCSVARIASQLDRMLAANSPSPFGRSISLDTLLRFVGLVQYGGREEEQQVQEATVLKILKEMVLHDADKEGLVASLLKFATLRLARYRSANSLELERDPLMLGTAYRKTSAGSKKSKAASPAASPAMCLVSKCERGHVLKEFVAQHSGYSCDGPCHASQYSGSTLFGCRQCDFDLCSSCNTVRAVSVPAGSVRLKVGDKVQLTPETGKNDGCLGRHGEGKVGKIIKDDHDDTPFKVLCDGDDNWYKERDLKLAEAPPVAGGSTGAGAWSELGLKGGELGMLTDAGDNKAATVKSTSSTAFLAVEASPNPKKRLVEVSAGSRYWEIELTSSRTSNIFVGVLAPKMALKLQLGGVTTTTEPGISTTLQARQNARESGSSLNGIKFDVEAKEQAVDISALFLVHSTGNTIDWKVYCRPGKHTWGSVNSGERDEYTLLASGRGSFTEKEYRRVELSSPVSVAAGEFCHFYIWTDSGSGLVFGTDREGYSEDECVRLHSGQVMNSGLWDAHSTDDKYTFCGRVEYQPVKLVAAPAPSENAAAAGPHPVLEAIKAMREDAAAATSGTGRKPSAASKPAAGRSFYISLADGSLYGNGCANSFPHGKSSEGDRIGVLLKSGGGGGSKTSGGSVTFFRNGQQYGPGFSTGVRGPLVFGVVMCEEGDEVTLIPTSTPPTDLTDRSLERSCWIMEQLFCTGVLATVNKPPCLPSSAAPSTMSPSMPVFACASAFVSPIDRQLLQTMWSLTHILEQPGLSLSLLRHLFTLIKCLFNYLSTAGSSTADGHGSTDAMAAYVTRRLEFFDGATKKLMLLLRSWYTRMNTQQKQQPVKSQLLQSLVECRLEVDSVLLRHTSAHTSAQDDGAAAVRRAAGPAIVATYASPTLTTDAPSTGAAATASPTPDGATPAAASAIATTYGCTIGAGSHGEYSWAVAVNGPTLPTVTLSESALPPSLVPLHGLFKKMDSNNDGGVDLTELEAELDRQGQSDDKDLAALLKLPPSTTVEKVAESKTKKSIVKKFFNAADADCDGSLTWDEFMRHVIRSNPDMVASEHMQNQQPMPSEHELRVGAIITPLGTDPTSGSGILGSEGMANSIGWSADGQLFAHFVGVGEQQAAFGNGYRPGDVVRFLADVGEGTVAFLRNEACVGIAVGPGGSGAAIEFDIRTLLGPSGTAIAASPPVPPSHTATPAQQTSHVLYPATTMWSGSEYGAELRPASTEACTAPGSNDADVRSGSAKEEPAMNALLNARSFMQRYIGTHGELRQGLVEEMLLPACSKGTTRVVSGGVASSPKTAVFPGADHLLVKFDKAELGSGDMLRVGATGGECYELSPGQLQDLMAGVAPPTEEAAAAPTEYWTPPSKTLDKFMEISAEPGNGRLQGDNRKFTANATCMAVLGEDALITSEMGEVSWSMKVDKTDGCMAVGVAASHFNKPHSGDGTGGSHRWMWRFESGGKYFLAGDSTRLDPRHTVRKGSIVKCVLSMAERTLQFTLDDVPLPPITGLPASGVRPVVYLSSSNAVTLIEAEKGADSPLVKGAVVQARYAGGEEWYNARIVGAHPNGGFDIKYTDGDEESGVAANLIRVGGGGRSASAGRSAGGEIAVNDTVVRGPDWTFGDDDGGAGEVGVVEMVGANLSTVFGADPLPSTASRSTIGVRVRWGHDGAGTYRYGVGGGGVSDVKRVTLLSPAHSTGAERTPAGLEALSLCAIPYGLGTDQAAAASAPAKSELGISTTLQARSGTSSGSSLNGIKFDVEAKKQAVDIRALFLVHSTDSTIDWKVYCRPGKHTWGSVKSGERDEYTLLASGRGSFSENEYRRVELSSPVSVAAGEFCHFYIWTSSGSGVVLGTDREGYSEDECVRLHSGQVMNSGLWDAHSTDDKYTFCGRVEYQTSKATPLPLPSTAFKLVGDTLRMELLSNGEGQEGGASSGVGYQCTVVPIYRCNADSLAQIEPIQHIVREFDKVFAFDARTPREGTDHQSTPVAMTTETAFDTALVSFVNMAAAQQDLSLDKLLGSTWDTLCTNPMEELKVVCWSRAHFTLSLYFLPSLSLFTLIHSLSSRSFTLSLHSPSLTLFTQPLLLLLPLCRNGQCC
jgi:hypothetical protein